MIHFAEAVLPGHPDKFCDRIADAIVLEALQADPCAFAQVEVGVWADQLWLSGNIVTRSALPRSLADIVLEAGLSIGLDGSNWIDARRYCITNTLCQNIDDPTEGRGICDDQAIVIGYAGYDAQTRYLPPEQFLVHRLGAALWNACGNGALEGCGPDGKLLVVLREEGMQWHLERVLVTLQHPQTTGLMNLTAAVQQTLGHAYEALRSADPRWLKPWPQVDVTVNPNGPHYRAGSDSDNGQTGRKLVMDYYGPRVQIGGGALSGKHPAHIDRLAAHAARDAALHAVRTGARECTVRLAYAPNHNEPMEVVWLMEGRGERVAQDFFNFDAMLARLDVRLVMGELGMRSRP